MSVLKLGRHSEEIAIAVIQDAPIDVLHKELIELVLHVLDSPKEIFSLRATSKRYYSISHSKTLWRLLFLKHFPYAENGDLYHYKELFIRQKNIKANKCKEDILGRHEDAVKTLLVKENCL